MIYVELYGRLGNNMFQMAAATTLAKEYRTSLSPIAKEKSKIGEVVSNRMESRYYMLFLHIL